MKVVRERSCYPDFVMTIDASLRETEVEDYQASAFQHTNQEGKNHLQIPYDTNLKLPFLDSLVSHTEGNGQAPPLAIKQMYMNEQFSWFHYASLGGLNIVS